MYLIENNNLYNVENAVICCSLSRQKNHLFEELDTL